MKSAFEFCHLKKDSVFGINIVVQERLVLFILMSDNMDVKGRSDSSQIIQEVRQGRFAEIFGSKV